MLCLALGLLSFKNNGFSCSRGLPRPPLGTLWKPRLADLGAPLGHPSQPGSTPPLPSPKSAHPRKRFNNKPPFLGAAIGNQNNPSLGPPSQPRVPPACPAQTVLIHVSALTINRPFWEQPSETRKTHPWDLPASLEYPLAHPEKC